MRRRRRGRARAPRPTLLGQDEATGVAGDAIPAAGTLPPVEERSCATASPIPTSPPRWPPRWRASTPPPPPIRRWPRTFRPTTSSTTSGWSPTWWPPAARTPGPAPPRCSALVAATAGQQARAGARRRQPEEHPVRPRMARCSWTRNAPGGAIRPSISPSASTTCC